MNSVPHSAGIVLSIWQATVPKLIPMEFRELTGFQQESVEDSKDLIPRGTLSGILTMVVLWIPPDSARFQGEL